MTSTATVRRPRGGLEELVREVCDQITLGAIEGDGPWTTHRLAKLIAERFPGSGVTPSTGAIGDTLKRWNQIGFAEITEGSPLAFVGFTDAAQDVGLTELKSRHRKAQYAARKAEKAAASAPANGSSEDHDGHTVVIEDAPVVEAPEPTGEPGPTGVESWEYPEPERTG